MLEPVVKPTLQHVVWILRIWGNISEIPKTSTVGNKAVIELVHHEREIFCRILQICVMDLMLFNYYSYQPSTEFYPPQLRTTSIIWRNHQILRLGTVISRVRVSKTVPSEGIWHCHDTDRTTSSQTRHPITHDAQYSAHSLHIRPSLLSLF